MAEEEFEKYDDSDKLTKAKRVRYWLNEIKEYNDLFEPWISKSESIIDIFTQAKELKRSLASSRYRSFYTDNNQTTFNILYSNTDTTVPLLLGEAPKSSITRRHKDKLLKGRLAAEILQRVVTYEIEEENWLIVLRRIATDNQLVGRGVGWLVYNYEEDELGNITNPEASFEYIHYKDFAHSAKEKTWEDNEKRGWVSRKAELTKEEFKEKFPDVDISKINMKEKDGTEKKSYEVYEIWDARKRNIIYVCESYKEDILREQEDLYKLKKFFPCSEPFYANISNENLVPLPPYLFYERQARQLNDVTNQINLLTEKLEVTGFYDASQQNIADLLKNLGSGGNKFHPVQSVESGKKISDSVLIFDILPIVRAIDSLYIQQRHLIEEIRELTGMSDSYRGVVDPREKLGQTEIKAAALTSRISTRQKDFDRCVLSALKKKVEIISRLYPPQLMRNISGFDYFDEIQDMYNQNEDPVLAKQAVDTLFNEVIELLKNDEMMNFVISIETDSMRMKNQRQQQEEVMNFMTAVGGLMKESMPMIQAEPATAPLVASLISFMVRQNPQVGRTIESQFEEFAEKISQSYGQTNIEQIVQAMQQGAEQIKELQGQVGQIVNFINQVAPTAPVETAPANTGAPMPEMPV